MSLNYGITKRIVPRPKQELNCATGQQDIYRATNVDKTMEAHKNTLGK